MKKYPGLKDYPGRWGKEIMNKFTKILFWSVSILLGFVNPLISFGLIILYYLPSIIQEICDSCKEKEMNFYSEDILEDMK